jgi:hypothetical protein
MKISIKDLETKARQYGVYPIPYFKDKPRMDTKAIPYYKWIVTAHPEWNELVMDKIHHLGDITFKQGHNKDLDFLKNYLWSMVGIPS